MPACRTGAGLDALDGLGGGAPDGAVVAVVQVDGEGVVGDVHGYDLAGVDAAERDFLAGDHDDAAVAGAALDGDGLCGRFRRRPGLNGGGLVDRRALVVRP